jgi:putative transposase
MSGRRGQLTNSKIFHIFNKTIDSRPVFSEPKSISLFVYSCSFYRSNLPNISFSLFRRIQNVDIKKSLIEEIISPKLPLVKIYAYCIMPTHFHFLLQSCLGGGISKFTSNITNSYTRYYNRLNNRKGQLFLHQFKSVEILNEMQFMYVSRYIHLNPYSSSVVSSIDKLKNYKWSSLKEYLDGKSDKISLINQDLLLGMFDYERERYKKYVFEFADEQRRREILKHKLK